MTGFDWSHFAEGYAANQRGAQQAAGSGYSADAIIRRCRNLLKDASERGWKLRQKPGVLFAVQFEWLSPQGEVVEAELSGGPQRALINAAERVESLLNS